MFFVLIATAWKHRTLSYPPFLKLGFYLVWAADRRSHGSVVGPSVRVFFMMVMKMMGRGRGGQEDSAGRVWGRGGHHGWSGAGATLLASQGVAAVMMLMLIVVVMVVVVVVWAPHVNVGHGPRHHDLVPLVEGFGLLVDDQQRGLVGHGFDSLDHLLVVLVVDVDAVDFDDPVPLFESGGFGGAVQVHLPDELSGLGLLGVQVESVSVKVFPLGDPTESRPGGVVREGADVRHHINPKQQPRVYTLH